MPLPFRKFGLGVCVDCAPWCVEMIADVICWSREAQLLANKHADYFGTRQRVGVAIL